LPITGSPAKLKPAIISKQKGNHIVKQHLTSQRGAAHLILILVIVLGLVAVLGFVGYNAWQKQSAGAGGSDTVGGVTPTVSVSPNGFNSYNFQPVIGKDKGGDALQIPKANDAFGHIASADYDEGAPSEGTKYLEKLGDFARKAAGKKVRVCIEVRLEKAVADKEVYLYQSYIAEPDEHDGGDKTFKVGVTYKNYCMTANYVGKKEMDKVLSAADPRTFNVGINNNSKTKLYIRKATLKVVE